MLFFCYFLLFFCRLKEFERFVRSFTAELICIEWKECLCELNPFKSIHRGKNILITFRKRKKPSEKCLQLESCYCSLKIVFIFTVRSNFFLLTETVNLFLGLNKGTISTDIHLMMCRLFNNFFFLLCTIYWMQKRKQELKNRAFLLKCILKHFTSFNNFEWNRKVMFRKPFVCYFLKNDNYFWEFLWNRKK